MTAENEQQPQGHAGRETKIEDLAARNGPGEQHQDRPEAAAEPANAEPIPDEVQAEIDAAMRDLGLAGDAASPGQASAQPGAEAHRAPKIRGPRVVQGGREHRTGTVVSVGPSDIFVEFGPKELGVVDNAQYPEDERPKVGDQLEVVVTRFEPSESLYICSRPGAVQKAEWELLEPGQVVEVRVSAVNKGGLECEVSGHTAFMPASQVSLDRVNDLSVFVGEKMTCQVQRVDRRGKGNIVLSRRDVLTRERAEQAAKLRDTLHEGQVLDGTVRKIMPFGAFVDLGGVDGLVHVSDLTHERVGHGEKAVARHVSEGQKVRVQVLSLDWESNRISLGMKQLQADPFAEAAQEVTEGAEISGRVTKIVEFGCFVEVAPGVEGLVHISELDYRRVGKPSDVVRENEVVSVKVLKIDPDTRKISLSIKALKEPPAAPAGGRKGRGAGDRDSRSPEEIKKETPAFRRLREQAKAKATTKKSSGMGGLGDGLGDGLADLARKFGNSG